MINGIVIVNGRSIHTSMDYSMVQQVMCCIVWIFSHYARDLMFYNFVQPCLCEVRKKEHLQGKCVISY